MTITTETNEVTYDGDDAVLEFPYNFKVIDKLHMRVFIDGGEIFEDDVNYPFSVLGVGDGAGGTVTFSPTPPPAGVNNVTLLRDVPATQEIDYTPYDDFPAETHERGLDKLTMLVQQAINSVDNAIHIPIIESSVVYNTEVPAAHIRAGKFLFFDDIGNVSVVDAELAVPAVYGVLIDPDHQNRLRVDSTDANYPVLSTIVNKPNALVQLDDQGNVPLDHLNLAGLRVMGLFRGDDLCPKFGDNQGIPECIAPDTRNPSQRFPELVPDPGEDNSSKFQGGDYFIFSMAPGELSGSVELYAEPGAPTPAATIVEANDGCMYLREVKDELGVIVIHEGWYFLRQIVQSGTALDTLYDPIGNTYMLGENLQIAMDEVDAEFVKRDQFFLTKKNINREALVPAGNDLNSIVGTGFYIADKSTWGPDSDPATGVAGPGTFTVTHTSAAPGLYIQEAVDLTTAVPYVRRFNGGAWGAWKELLSADTVLDAIQEAIDTNNDALYPIGAYYVGPDPSGLLTGTWTQVPEGTFLMNTVADNDPSGGANSIILAMGNMPSHNHGGGAHTHTVNNVGVRTGNGPTDDNSSPGPDNMANVVTTDSGVIVNLEGNGDAFDNRPKYKGVKIWERTA